MAPPPYFREDLIPGATFGTGTLTVDAAAITAFATQFDPQPFHLDPAAAAASVFGALVASGWHTAALTMRLLVIRRGCRRRRARPCSSLPAG